jgi:hypothetical protein
MNTIMAIDSPIAACTLFVLTTNQRNRINRDTVQKRRAYNIYMLIIY